MDTISSFFSRSSEVPTVEPEVSIPFKVIPERETYFQILPDEILEMIFKLISGQTRLETLPKVSYQFYVVSREFFGKCYHLHHLIPLAFNSLDFPDASYRKYIHILHFKGGQKLSVYNITFDSEELSSTELKSCVTSLKKVDDDLFDVLTFRDELRTLIFQKVSDDYYFINHHLISNQYSKLANRYRNYPLMLKDTENDHISLLYNYLLDEEILEKLAKTLIYHGQKFLLNHADEDSFWEDFISLFEKIHLDAFEILAEKTGSDMIDKLYNQMLTYAQLPLQKCVRNLKEYIKKKLKGFNSKCSYKNSLIFVSEIETIYTTSKKLFSNRTTYKLISAEFFLHQIIPSSELSEERQWFADKLLSLAKK